MILSVHTSIRIEPGVNSRLHQTVQHLADMGYQKPGYLCLQHRVARDIPDFLEVMRVSGLDIDEDRYPWHREGDERVVMVVRPVKVSGMG